MLVQYVASFFAQTCLAMHQTYFTLLDYTKISHYIWWIHEDKAKQTCFIVVQVLGSSTKGGTKKGHLKENLKRKLKKIPKFKIFFFNQELINC